MNSSQSSNTKIALYLYCLCPASNLISNTMLAQFDLPGVDGRYPLNTLVVGQVAAVVGQIQTTDFSEVNLQTIEWLATRAFQHEAIVERVMAQTTVLPVKFGTIFDSSTSLISFVSAQQKKIVTGLMNLRDQSEWSVKGYLSQERAEKRVCALNQPIQEKIDSLSSSPGVRYLQQRQLATQIDTAINAWLDEACAATKANLIKEAKEAFDLRCHSNAVTGRDESMVFNCSFLVADTALEQFQREFHTLQLDQAHAGLNLELRGPWPPYNFCPTLTDTSV